MSENINDAVVGFVEDRRYARLYLDLEVTEVGEYTTVEIQDLDDNFHGGGGPELRPLLPPEDIMATSRNPRHALAYVLRQLADELVK